MEFWTVIGSIAAVLGLAAIPVAIYIHRKQADGPQQEIYKKALDALADLDSRVKRLDFRTLTDDAIKDLDLDAPLNVMQNCASDSATPLAKDNALRYALTRLEFDIAALDSLYGLPNSESLYYSYPRERNEDALVEFHGKLVELISKGVRQEFARRDLGDHAKEVRRILTAYRSGRSKRRNC